MQLKFFQGKRNIRNEVILVHKSNYCTHSILRLVVDVSTEENNVIWVFTHRHHFWFVRITDENV